MLNVKKESLANEMEIDNFYFKLDISGIFQMLVFLFLVSRYKFLYKLQYYLLYSILHKF